jgi:hypothetical protein
MNIVYLKKSNKIEKKYMVNIDGKMIYFGAAGMSDFTIHKDPKRKERYIKRHQKRENWSIEGLKTAGFWSRWLLWNKPTISQSKKDISNRFNIKFKI